MSMKLGKNAYKELIQGNIDWLLKQSRTLQRDHILEIVKASIDYEYPPADERGGWSEDIPKGPGYYWIRSHYFGEQVMEVFYRPGHKYLCIQNPEQDDDGPRDFIAISKLDAEWSDRIPKPKEKKP